ncbi:endopolyphosphatase [Monosporozyma unispora]|nr:Endopolyphosphatase [Kazachstania unispora]
MFIRVLILPCICVFSILLYLNHNGDRVINILTTFSTITSSGNKDKRLHGRFLHITDIHPDEHYKEGNSINLVCHYPATHNHHDINDKDWAPKFGKPMAGCDSPMDLMEYTLKWVVDNLKDEVDFIIWTGDNMRHDNDRMHPRLESKIFAMNELLTHKFYTEVCKDPRDNNPRDLAIDLIPSIGNNDVFPHNLLAMGPTLQTREFYRIWHWFIPEEQQKLFSRYGSFVKEVIPGQLAVISINTLYMFKANPLVDNCMKPSEPGYQLLIWLGFVLEEMRSRGIKVWLSGHVPPLEKNLERSCYHKFTLWTHEYRDIIVGGVYGHMNMDHFVPVNGPASRRFLDDLNSVQDYEDELMSEIDLPFLAQGSKPTNKESYMETVRDTIYGKIAKKLSPKRRKRKGKKPKTARDLQYKYSVVNVAGSVIPTFNPSMRIWEYNISDWEQQVLFQQNYEPWEQFFTRVDNIIKEEASAKTTRKEDKTVPPKMPKDMSLGPAYVPQLFSPTRFIQYYADLDKINDNYYQYIEEGLTEDEAADKAFKYEIEYTSEDGPYNKRSLMVHDYMEIAAQLSKDNKQWKKYLHKVFGSTGYTDD